MSPAELSKLAIILIFLCLAAVVTVKESWLTAWGAIGMVIMGIFIYLSFGLLGLLIIFLFFLSSNLIGKLNHCSSDKQSKHEPRTLKQVLANGGVPLLSALFVILGGPYSFGLGCYLISIAQATADTWASEAGTRIAVKPYHIALRRKVTPGLSGAVTGLGSVVGGLGAVLIGIVSTLLFFHQSFWEMTWAFMLISIIGWGGQWIDTVFGAFLQARYHCQICNTLTDNRHHCGHATELVHGHAWVTNNVVNAFSSISSGVIGGIGFLIIFGGSYIV